MITLIKGDSVKIVDQKSNLIPILKADGWKLEEAKTTAKKTAKK